MAKKPSFTKIHILIADNDVLLARVLAQNLRAIGFPNVHHVRNGELALQYIENEAVDLLITEWEMKPVDGLELIQRIRQLNTSKRTMPIIMLTGKGELQDISVARDTGITEFVVKPFTAATLYRRIEQIAENPRGFVLSDEYVGPDRRRKVPPGEEEDERRTNKPAELISSGNVKSGVKFPAIVKPDGAFKKNLGITGPLSSIITPKVLEEAQKVIDSIADESLKWIKDDINMLVKAHADLSDTPSELPLEKAKTAALSIKSRAGTFGYPLASEAGRLLYLFLSSDFSPAKKTHLNIYKKHIETIQVMIAQQIKGHDKVGSELIAELRRVVSLQK